MFHRLLHTLRSRLSSENPHRAACVNQAEPHCVTAAVVPALAPYKALRGACSCVHHRHMCSSHLHAVPTTKAPGAAHAARFYSCRRRLLLWSADSTLLRRRNVRSSRRLVLTHSMNASSLSHLRSVCIQNLAAVGTYALGRWSARRRGCRGNPVARCPESPVVFTFVSHESEQPDEMRVK